MKYILTNKPCDIIILAGQSNAVGCGCGEVSEKISDNDEILLFYDTQNEGFILNEQGKEVLEVKRPFVYDVKIMSEENCSANIAFSFANQYIKEGKLKEGRKLLIVRAAVGGTGFFKHEWSEDGILFERMKDMISTVLSMHEDNKVIAMCWHQGESDAFEKPELDYETRKNSYIAHFEKVISTVRDMCDNPQLPVLAGGFTDEWSAFFSNQCEAVIQAIMEVFQKVGYARFNSSNGLLSNNQKTANGDDIHFCNESLHILGEKYYSSYKEILSNDNDFVNACRKVIPEGIVLLENDKTFPLRRGQKIALFGRAQFEYLKGGSGSGGRVNCPYVITIYQALKDQLCLDFAVSDFYRDFIEKNPYDCADNWLFPTFQKEAVLEDEFVLQASKNNDVAIFVLYRLAGESYDIKPEKGGWYLTAEEERAIALLTKHFSKVAVLVNSANIIDLSWIKKYNVGTVALIWGGGQVGAIGVADAIMGTNPPSGRLTDTVAKKIESYPAHGNFGDAIKNVHVEDIYVGYRYFETFSKEEVLYPFGYGLGYTEFEQKVICTKKEGEKVKLTVSVKNVGEYKGKEVVQVYYSAPEGMLGKPARELVAFKKTKLLLPNEEEIIQIDFNVAQMASYDDSGKSGFAYSYVLEKGNYGIYVGENVRQAQEILSFSLTQTICVQKCEQRLAPVEEFERMVAKDGHIAYEKTPVDKRPLSQKGMQDHLDEITYTGDRGITLQQVQKGEYTLDEFVAQFTAIELSYLTKGEGMSSPKALWPGTASCSAGVAKLFFLHGVPVLSACDGPSGIRLECGVPATSLPMGTLIACAWAPELFEEIFVCFAEEMKRYDIDFNLGPGINIHRHPLCGRNFEYFSEDPLITGNYSLMIAKTMLKNGVYCTLKHFAVNSQEFKRGSENEVLSERALREIYLKGFEIAVKSGFVRAIMTSYNRINGVSAPSNYDLVGGILRKEWGYDGLVMTDWWSCMDDLLTGGFSIKHLTAMVEAQTDVFMVVPDSVSYDDDLKDSIERGRLSLAQLQLTAKRILSIAMGSYAFSKGERVFVENDFSTITNVVYQTDAIKNGEKVIIDVKPDSYVAELEYNVEGDPLIQITTKVFVDKNDAITLILNKTEGKNCTTRFRIILAENSCVWIEGEGVKSLKLMQVR